ncbi:MAG: hypothetical protein ACD_34C00118G0001 [uncultured bacterium]|nr:MAG: hypothetical protein ACD_34C00118G0001 [uncultured bacterium]
MRERVIDLASPADFPSSNNHTRAEVNRALAHFIDPENSRMRFSNFMENMMEMMVGDELEDDLDVSQVQMLEKIRDMVGYLDSARRFNNRYIGHMLSESCVPALLGSIAALRLGGNTVAREVSFRESNLEHAAMTGLMEIVGYEPGKASGTFTSGGTMANVTALAVARKRIEADHKLYGESFNKRLCVLSIPQAHYSVRKAVDLLSGPNLEVDPAQISEALGNDWCGPLSEKDQAKIKFLRDVEFVSVRTKGLKMDPESLEETIREIEEKGERQIMAVVAVPGETETGLVDPLDEILEITRRHGIFSIADGAYGAPFRLSKYAGGLFASLGGFDAVVVDPHKALYTPYANGAVLFRDAWDHLLLVKDVRAEYVGFQEDLVEMLRELRTGEGSLGQKRIEGSMGPGPILATLAVLDTLGTEGLAVVYDMNIERTRFLYQRVRASEWLVPMHKPDLNLLCFALSDQAEELLGITNNKARKEYINQLRTDLDDQIQGEGGFFFSATDLPLDGMDDEGKPLSRFVFRSCIMHPRTTDKIVSDAVAALEKLIQERIYGPRRE